MNKLTLVKLSASIVGAIGSLIVATPIVIMAYYVEDILLQILLSLILILAMRFVLSKTYSGYLRQRGKVIREMAIHFYVDEYLKL